MSGIIIDPLFYGFDGAVVKGLDVSAFGDEPANNPVGVFISASLPRSIGMCIKDRCAQMV